MKKIDPDHKPRVQGKFAMLTEAQRQQILDWMKEGLIYRQIQKRISDTFGVTISHSSLSEYYSKHARTMVKAQSGGETLHATLVLHLQIIPELLRPSDGN